MSPYISVIIPTYNRIDLLTRVIGLLFAQASDIDYQLEILVIDDGSNNDVCSFIDRRFNGFVHDNLVRCFQQCQSGPAAARNLGIREAIGDVVLFIGDDILPLDGFLQTHFYAHKSEYPEENFAVLGMADIAPEFQTTPFVNWWRHWNFRYWLLLEGRKEPDYSFFYTNNLSLKRSFLLRHGMFDEDFQYAAYEDGELGARLIMQGLRLIFEPKARAHHYHRIDLDAACMRMVTRGKAYDLFVERTSLPGISKIWKLMGYGPWMQPFVIRFLYKCADYLQSRLVFEPLFILVLMYFFQVGRGLKEPINEIPTIKKETLS
jgi:glycosyltransferase involved in cell wall biosynthesis